MQVPSKYLRGLTVALSLSAVLAACGNGAGATGAASSSAAAPSSSAATSSAAPASSSASASSAAPTSSATSASSAPATTTSSSAPAATASAASSAGSSTASAAAAAASSVAITVGNPAKAVTLLESGSSLLYPLFQLWAPAIQQKYANISIQPQSTGSGTGISQASAGAVQIGASDAYMADAQIAQVQGGILNIPTAISAQQINYNLPGVTGNLQIDGPALAAIFSGKVTYWDDPMLTAQNSGMTLPHQKIVPVHRTDGSGDTFIFTQYLSDTDSGWKGGPGFGTSVNWPSVPGGLGANGNAGVVQTLAQTKYSIGYVGVSFLDEATKQGLGEAKLKNQAGSYLLPTNDTISAAAAQMIGQTPKDERISLIFAPGANSYPIINYEYVLVKPAQPDADTALALRSMLAWAISPDGGNSDQFLSKVHFIALPAQILPLSQAQIAQIH